MHDTTQPIRPRLARISAVAAIAALALVGCATAEPAPAPAPDHSDASTVAPHQHYFVSDAWVAASEDDTATAYAVIDSQGHHDVVLDSVTTPTAGTTELLDASGAAVDGFALAVDERLTLEPGGAHVALRDLTGPLAAGDEVDLTFTFSDGETTTVTAPVREAAE